jgi:hypothetical protein
MLMSARHTNTFTTKLNKCTHTYIHAYKHTYIPMSSICCLISDSDKDFGCGAEEASILPPISSSCTSNFLLDLLKIILYVAPIIIMK